MRAAPGIAASQSELPAEVSSGSLADQTVNAGNRRNDSCTSEPDVNSTTCDEPNACCSAPSLLARAGWLLLFPERRRHLDLVERDDRLVILDLDCTD
jgi:hypothetical protein